MANEDMIVLGRFDRWHAAGYGDLYPWMADLLSYHSQDKCRFALSVFLLLLRSDLSPVPHIRIQVPPIPPKIHTPSLAVPQAHSFHSLPLAVSWIAVRRAPLSYT